MTLAFYAPLKSPHHPVPSGDRSMARALIAALESAGFAVDLASELPSRDGKGDAAVQRDIQAQAQAAVQATDPRQTQWTAWITYHNYYKAPDLLGPTTARRLGIPYIQVESTRAKKRLGGPWDGFARAAEAATDAADLIFYLTNRDAEALRDYAPQGQHLSHLRPFLTRSDLPEASTGQGPMLSVGMMRAGDKLASYHIIADTLAMLPAGTWSLHIAGDGPARAEVEALMAPFGDAVTFRGALDAEALAQAYRSASLFLWPGVNEAFGMAYLEAQAHGLPVVAQDRPGVCDVLAPGVYPTPNEGAAALATRIEALMNDADHRIQAGQTTRAYIADHHLMPAAAATLRAGLAQLGCTP